MIKPGIPARTVPVLLAPLLFVSTLAQGQSLEEITVTARKTAENLQDVPISVTAIGAQDIDRLGIQDLDDLTARDPSVQFDEGFTPSDTRVTIRGLSPTRGRPNAATLVDGIDVTSEAVSNAGGSLLINPRLLDVERIEIVKGPQSALYGRSAFAGAIQYVTKDPADVFLADVYVDYDSEQQKEVRGSVSVPLTDNLGMLVNGLWWDERGIYRNSMTGDFVGGGEGLGGSVTFKWEPTDTLDFKWRTEYTDDHFDPSAQVLLNDMNQLIDLGNGGNLDALLGANNPRNGGSNVAPTSSNCSTRSGQPAPGPLDNPGCLETQTLNQYFLENFEAPYTDPTPGFTPNLGQYDPTDPFYFNQFNKQVVSAYVGKIPDADQLRISLSPNYQYGPGAINPALAEDYEGIDKQVFRTSLVGNWNVADNLTLTSYSSYTDAKVWEALDLGKFSTDVCSADVAALEMQPDPTGTFASYADALRAQGYTNLAKFAPCNPDLGPDGIRDDPNSFIQNSRTDTIQLSQEFRAEWDINDDFSFTTGLLYWRERVTQFARNTTTIAAGPECYLQQSPSGAYRDISQVPGVNAFVGIDPIQDQCGSTSLISAYWMADTWQGRLEQPDVTDRGTDHYSWYGSLDWNLTSRASARFEARFTREDNEITGLVQTPCYDGSPANQGGPCQTTNPAAVSRDVQIGPQPTGKSTVIICGQLGRCDRVGIAPISGSPYYAPGLDLADPTTGPATWWPWGFKPAPGSNATLNRTDRYWAPKFTLNYYLTDDVLGYFSWSRGIKPGGFTLLTAAAFGLDANLDNDFSEIEYEPERLDVWEIGLKSTWLDGRVRLNGAIFYQDFKDKQVTVQAVVGNTVGTVVKNIPGSEIRGLELDGAWQITDKLRLSGGYTFLDSEYTDYKIITSSANDIARVVVPQGSDCDIAPVEGSDPADPEYGCLVSLNGNDLERSPKHSIVADLNFTDALGDTGLEWFSEVNFRYQDSRFVEAFNIVEFKAYTRTNLRVGLLSDQWDLQLYVNNVFDDDTIISGGANPGIPTGSFGFGLATPPFPPGINAGPKLASDIYANLPDPRIIGMRATFRFGQ